MIKLINILKEIRVVKSPNAEMIVDKIKELIKYNNSNGQYIIRVLDDNGVYIPSGESVYNLEFYKNISQEQRNKIYKEFIDALDKLKLNEIYKNLLKLF